MSGTILRRRDRTARPPRVEHYSSAVNIAAHLAKTMAMMCVRNTMIEDIHAGLTPVT